MLVLKPIGRGNWTPVYMQLSGYRAQPLLFRVGSTIDLAGLTFRICRVHA